MPYARNAVGGQQPYAIDREGPLFRVVSESLLASRNEGSLEPFAQALEAFAGGRRARSPTASSLRVSNCGPTHRMAPAGTVGPDRRLARPHRQSGLSS
jgi:hypothetical protein